jgi:hypothetical protein
MAHTTSHPFVYDCETCNGVASFDNGRQVWKHQDRRSTCPELAVVAVALTQLVTVAVAVDTVALAA